MCSAAVTLRFFRAPNAAPATQSHTRAQETPPLSRNPRPVTTRCACHGNTSVYKAPNAPPATQSHTRAPQMLSLPLNLRAKSHSGARSVQDGRHHATLATQSYTCAHQIPPLPTKSARQVAQCFACHAKKKKGPKARAVQPQVALESTKCRPCHALMKNCPGPKCNPKSFYKHQMLTRHAIVHPFFCYAEARTAPFTKHRALPLAHQMLPLPRNLRSK